MMTDAVSPLLASATPAKTHRAAPAWYLLDDPAEWPSFGKPTTTDHSTTTAAAEGLLWISHVVLEGMHCASCALTIEDALRAVPGVVHAEVSAAARRARVVWDRHQVLPSQWMGAIQNAGYRAAPACDAWARQVRVGQHRKALWRWLLATFCMMQVMMYAWPSYGAHASDLLMEHERLLRWASWVICIPLVIFACGPFFEGAWRDVRQGRIGMDMPVSLGMLIAFAVSTLGTLAPEGAFGHEVFYDSLSMFVCFLLTGRWLEVRLRDRTAGALDAVLNRLPDSINKQMPDGRFERVALRRIAVGDVLRILPGEAFAADGTIVQGHTQADEALLTGESRPVLRSEGDTVIAGSFNLSAAVLVRVDAVGARTQFAQIVNLMESAATQKPRLARLADRIAGPFLAVVLVLAAVAAWYWWRTDPGHALMIAAAVLIVTCPCALSLATPVTMLTAAGTLARHGVLVRNLQGLEALAQIDTLVFDKTGTLTCDGMQVAAMHTRGHSQPHNWQGLAAAVAAHSCHPVSQAVLRYGQAWTAKWQVQSVQEIAGRGLRAQVRAAGQPDTAAFFVRLGAAEFAAAPPLHTDGQAVYLAQEVSAHTHLTLARFDLHEGVRPEAARVVQQLQSSGLQVQLMSGDGAHAVARIADQVGIAQHHALCAPHTKLARVSAAQQAGQRVGMVGDGLNDGPVLAGADVSFAFGRAVPLAQARSDFVVLSDNLELVWHTTLLARQTLRVVRQNLWGSALYNALCIPLAMVGWMPAWLAGLGMALSSLLVVLNAARLARPLPVHSGADNLAPASAAPARA